MSLYSLCENFWKNHCFGTKIGLLWVKSKLTIREKFSLRSETSPKHANMTGNKFMTSNNKFCPAPDEQKMWFLTFHPFYDIQQHFCHTPVHHTPTTTTYESYKQMNSTWSGMCTTHYKRVPLSISHFLSTFINSHDLTDVRNSENG